MGNLFGNIYYLFVGMFGQHLSDYLWGYNCQTQAFNASVVYLPIGLVMTLLTALLCTVYYFVLNHPRLNKWLHWLITAGITMVLNVLVAGIWTSEHLNSGRIASCLAYQTMANGTTVQNITEYDCWMFGVANGIVSLFFFIILSAVVKRWSRNCRHTPWRSLFPKRNK
ncbi:MAG: hypothetical protein IJ684_00835 [Bacteroidales bacterium]|nr:hypothetical protein [Bacteroidales bacterium]